MDILQEQYNKKQEKGKAQKIVLSLLITTVVLFIIALGVLIYLLTNTQEKPYTFNLNGEIISDIISYGNVNYVSIKNIASKLGNSYYKGEYKVDGDEDINKCYIKTNTDIVGFCIDSNKIYKVTNGAELDYQYYKLNNNVISYNNQLYIAIEDLRKKF